MAKRGSVNIRTKKYDRFRGVDFSTDPALVDDARSPWAPNMISDNGGMPEKRPGWRVLHTIDGRINGLFRGKFDDAEHLLVHAGQKLYRWYESETAPEELCSDLPDDRSTAVYLGGCLWIFTGAKLLRYNGEEAVSAANVAYVPKTKISVDPKLGGGITYESVNMLSSRQRVTFLADGETKVYKLPYDSIDDDNVVVKINGEPPTTEFTVQKDKGTVTFTEAPAAPLAGAGDNVEIEFSKTIEKHTGRIGKCRTAIVWGTDGAGDRIVAAGNPDYPNQDYISGYADASYWPEENYTPIGTEETAIMGYRRLGESLAIIKEDNGQDSTVFIRTGVVQDDGSAVFPVKPCLSGAGAVTRFGFGNIGDEQLFLTGVGVYAITTNSLTAERIVQNRSFRVDPKLTKEKLQDAVTCSYRGSYLIFVDGKVYGLDGMQAKSYPSKQNTEFLYECFYWENVPARCVLRTMEDGEETLFFGTEDGCICRFNTDVETLSRFSDGGDRNLAGGQAITAVWSTRSDDDGDPMVLKTLLKKGNAVTMKPFNRSSGRILFRTDKDAVAWDVNFETLDILDWEDIDFSRFTFNSNDAPMEIPFNRKVKNYKRLQIMIKNDTVNEGFGVYGIVKHYVTGNFAKR